MIDKEIFETIEEISWQIEKEVNHEDIVLAFLSELGEIAQAIRVENHAPMVNHKSITESSKVEIVDAIMILTEWYIRRGGTLEEMYRIVKVKLPKWISIVNRFRKV